jgi:uncharacterized protein YhbP (UPF0306 family)
MPAPASAFRERLNAYLAEQTTLTLASACADGSPHACDLFYAHTSNLTLYFLSNPKTQHAQNLARAPRVSATIHGLSRGWEDIRGVQIEGVAARVTDPVERARAFALYVGKYGFIKQWLTNVDALGTMLKELGVVELYKISPQWIRSIDNTLGFGHKEELDLSSNSL